MSSASKGQAAPVAEVEDALAVGGCSEVSRLFGEVLFATGNSNAKGLSRVTSLIGSVAAAASRLPNGGLSCGRPRRKCAAPPRTQQAGRQIQPNVGQALSGALVASSTLLSRKRKLRKRSTGDRYEHESLENYSNVSCRTVTPPRLVSATTTRASE